MKKTIRVLRSTLDKSIKWVIPHGDGSIETKFVRRDSKYPVISAYVSSHNGYKMGCKFCFLAQLEQTSFKHTKLYEYNSQLDLILSHYKYFHKPTDPAVILNVNFMSRGEPLANSTIVNNYPVLYESYEERAFNVDLNLKMNISTIIPKLMRNRNLADIFRVDNSTKWGNTELYYSMHSVDEDFREFWMPGSLPYREALDKLKQWQVTTNLPITFHWTFIKGHNDSKESVNNLAAMVQQYEFFGKFNLEHTSESPLEQINEYLEVLKGAIIPTSHSKVVNRCGGRI